MAMVTFRLYYPWIASLIKHVEKLLYGGCDYRYDGDLWVIERFLGENKPERALIYPESNKLKFICPVSLNNELYYHEKIQILYKK